MNETESPLCPACAGRGGQPASPGSTEGFYIPCTACAGTGIAGGEYPPGDESEPIAFPPDEDEPAPAPRCAWRGCDQPATRLVRWDDDQEDEAYPYCDEHADEVADRAYQYGSAIASELIAVAAALGDGPGPDDDPTDPDPDPTDPDLPPVPPAAGEDRASVAPGACEVAGCSRPATHALTDQDAAGAHRRYLCSHHAAQRRALARWAGARFHITADEALEVIR